MNNAFPEKPFATVKEAAKISGISEYQMRQWLRARQIKHLRCGAKYLVDMDGLFQFLDEMSAQNCRGCQ